jgi:hypothetical protein
MPAYRPVIDITIAAIAKRARNFRNQIVVVVSLVLLITAAVFLSLRPLVGLLALVPLSGLFLSFDAKLLANWRSFVLKIWAQRDIDMLAFNHALRAIPHLPEATLTSMVDLLGTAQVWKIEARASVQTRQAVAAVVLLADTLGLRQLAAKVCAAAIVTVSVCWAAAAQSWRPLGMVTAVLLIPLVMRWLKASLQRQSRAALLAARQHPDFDAEFFRLLIEQFPLGGGQLAGDGWVDAAGADK